MTAVLDSLSHELELDFELARRDWSHARSMQRRKDTPEHRSAVAGSLTRIDVILDMYLAWGRLTAVRTEPG